VDWYFPNNLTLELKMNILCLDIGSNTQDVLYYSEEGDLENCPKFVLPSPAVKVAKRIEKLTRSWKAIYLYGQNMGGGFARALDWHLEKGLAVAAHPRAALALADDLEKVKDMGISISEECPLGFVPVHLTDFDPGFWDNFLASLDLDYPDFVLAAAQDHGFHPGKSNRKGRFELWKEFLSQGNYQVQELVFNQAPESLTRLRSIQDSIGGGLVADTSSAAALGALFVPEVESCSQQEAVCLVNLGNSHTTAFLVYKGSVYGIYEQHTGLLQGEKLWQDLQAFQQGELSEDQVFAENGHGCLVLDIPAQAQGRFPTYVLGPKRRMLEGWPVGFPAPGGDMMLAGCFGLLKGWDYLQAQL
jgi:uncharacterized protein (DUF1786 family)